VPALWKALGSCTFARRSSEKPSSSDVYTSSWDAKEASAVATDAEARATRDMRRGSDPR